MRPEVIYSFYYRNLLPEAVIELAPLGAFNLHGSLLPKYRGRAPVNWMLVNGETTGGVTLHDMVARADAGDIVAQRAAEITNDDDALTLYKKIVPLGAAIIREYHPIDRRRERTAASAGYKCRQLFRTTPSRRWANRLAMARTAHLQFGARGNASISGGVLFR